MIALVLAAQAQQITYPELDAQRYRLPVDATSTLWADDSTLAAGPSARLAVGFLKEPMVWIWGDTGERIALVDNVLGVDVIAGFALWRIRGAVDVPLYPVATGALESGGGLGDVAVDLKGAILDREDAAIGLAIGGRMSFPTATTAVSLGGGGLGWEVSAIVDKQAGPLVLAANLGYRGVPDRGLTDLALSDTLVYRIGGGYGFGERAGISLDLAGQLAVADFAAPTGRSLEALLGGWVTVADPLTIRAGVGRGLLGGIGSPAARAVLAVAWQPPAKAKDTTVVEVKKEVRAPAAEKSKDFLVVPGDATLPPGIIHIEVTGPDGKPLGADWAFGTAARARMPAGLGSAKVPPGPWAILISAEGYGTQGVDVDVDTGMTTRMEVQLRRAQVRWTDERIELLTKLRWQGAALDPASGYIVDELAATLRAHPEARAVRVEGHTSNEGTQEENLALSGARAAAVIAALAERGLDAARFVPAGYGGARPIDKADTPEAWAKNQRIELVITARAP
ncbi:MAG: OmpA family protein [Pseudomonadota bacterium]|nr:OmpA family protein [Pseudomonadota bacterium]